MNKEQIILGMKIYSQNGIDFILGEEEQKILLEHIDKLEHNWNELKRWLEEEEQEYRKDSYSGEYGWIIGTMVRVLNKISELEEGWNNE